MRSGIQETFRGAGVFPAGKLYENMRWFTFSNLSAATRERGQTMDDALALNPRPSMLSHLQELERMHAGDKAKARVAQERYLKTIGASSRDTPTFTKAERRLLIGSSLPASKNNQTSLP